MWKGELRKHNLYQMCMKLIYLFQVYIGKTNLLMYKMPNTSPLKPFLETTPFHDRRV